MATLLTAETKKKHALTRQVSTLEAEKRTLRAQNTQRTSSSQESAYTLDQIRRHNTLSQTHTELSNEYDNAKREINELKENIQCQQSQQTALETSLRKTKKNFESLKVKNANQLEVTQELFTKVMVLEKR